eukprot:TRINITY_DN6887_c0_g1_i2.p1 TRINITY_DN6887_c0_g1~~TRINITY_DN6887_c0_g1_i2.p1  ORF type:complete len:854 (-),score=176.45 TRINITY_DN6887_c0_g1_i2:80-2641(-)
MQGNDAAASTATVAAATATATSATSTATAAEKEEEEEVCRICREAGTREQPLMKPCRCRGSVGFVHEGCLRRWVQGTLSARRHPQCEICHARYAVSYSRLHAPSGGAPPPLRFACSGDSPVLVHRCWAALAYALASLVLFMCHGSLVVKCAAFAVMAAMALRLAALFAPADLYDDERRRPRWLWVLCSHPSLLYQHLLVLVAVVGVLVPATGFAAYLPLVVVAALHDKVPDPWQAKIGSGFLLSWRGTEQLCLLGLFTIVVTAAIVWHCYQVVQVSRLTWRVRFRPCAVWQCATPHQRSWLSLLFFLPPAVLFWAASCQGKVAVAATMAAVLVLLCLSNLLLESDPLSKFTLVACAFYASTLAVGFLLVFGLAYPYLMSSKHEVSRAEAESLQHQFDLSMLYPQLREKEHARSPNASRTVSLTTRLGASNAALPLTLYNFSDSVSHRAKGFVRTDTHNHGCVAFDVDLTGTVALFLEGGCPPWQKCANALNAGSTAVLVGSTAPGLPPNVTTAEPPPPLYVGTRGLCAAVPFMDALWLFEAAGTYDTGRLRVMLTPAALPPSLPAGSVLDTVALRVDRMFCAGVGKTKKIHLYNALDSASLASFESSAATRVVVATAEALSALREPNEWDDCIMDCGGMPPTALCSAAPSCSLRNYCTYGDNSVCEYIKGIVYLGVNGTIIFVVVGIFVIATTYAVVSSCWAVVTAILFYPVLPAAPESEEEGSEHILTEHTPLNIVVHAPDPVQHLLPPVPPMPPPVLPVPLAVPAQHEQLNDAGAEEGELWLELILVVCYVIGAMAAGLEMVAWQKAVVLVCVVAVLVSLAVVRLLLILAEIYTVWLHTGEGISIHPFVEP